MYKKIFSIFLVSFFMFSTINVDFVDAAKSRKTYSRPKPKPKPRAVKTVKKVAKSIKQTTSKKSKIDVPLSGKSSRSNTLSAPPKKKLIAVNTPKPRKNASEIAAAKKRAAEAEKKAKLAAQKKINKQRNQNIAFQNATKGKNSSYDSKSIDKKRANWYSSHKTTQSSVFSRTDSIGGFDPGFLGVMLMSDEPGSAALWYGMTGNPWFAVMMANKKEEAKNSGDTELLARLDRIEAENARLKASGAIPQPGYIPPGVPAEVAFTKEILTGQVSDVVLKMSTGSVDGIYVKTCEGSSSKRFKGFKKNASEYNIESDCLQSTGGEQNIKRLIADKADLINAQTDSLYLFEKRYDFGDEQYVTHKEPFWLISKKDSDIYGIDDIDRGATVYAPGGATSSWKIMRDFAKNDTFMGMGGDSDYAKARLVSDISIDEAVDRVISDKNSVLFIVMGTGAEKLKRIDKQFGKKLRLVPVNDNRFVDITNDKGQRIYSECTIQKGTLPGLQAGKYWGQNNTNTLCVDGLLIISPETTRRISEKTLSMIQQGIYDTIDEMYKIN